MPSAGGLRGARGLTRTDDWIQSRCAPPSSVRGAWRTCARCWWRTRGRSCQARAAPDAARRRAPGVRRLTARPRRRRGGGRRSHAWRRGRTAWTRRRCCGSGGGGGGRGAARRAGGAARSWRARAWGVAPGASCSRRRQRRPRPWREEAQRRRARAAGRDVQRRGAAAREASAPRRLSARLTRARGARRSRTPHRASRSS